MSGIWKFFRRNRDVQGSVEDDAAGAEKRMAPRYRIGNAVLGSIVCQNTGAVFPIDNLSYSGIALTIPEDGLHRSSPLVSAGGFLRAQMLVVGQSVDVQVRRVFLSSKRGGYCISHETPDVLLFLREPLEMMRRGGDMVRIDPRFLKEQYQKEGWSYWRADAGIDLRLYAPKSVGKLQEAIMTFRVLDRYYEVIWQQDLLITRVPASSGGVLDVGMQQNVKPDVEVVRQAVCLLLGLTSTIRDPVVSELIGLFSRFLEQEWATVKST